MEQTASLIIPIHQAPARHLRFGEARILMDGERYGGAWWMGHFREDQGFMTWHELKAGTLAVAPRGSPHAQGNRGSQPVLLFGAGNPAGFERFFAAQHEILSRVPPEDPQLPIEIAGILRRHDTQVMGPPPH